MTHDHHTSDRRKEVRVRKSRRRNQSLEPGHTKQEETHGKEAPNQLTQLKPETSAIFARLLGQLIARRWVRSQSEERQKAKRCT